MFDLPDWFSKFRDHQLVAISQIMAAYNSGAKVVFLDAPTGSGKTLIAEAVRQLLSAKQNNYQAVYSCTTKTLQNQFVEDYNYARVLKGKANYPVSGPELAQIGYTAEDCTGNSQGFTPESFLTTDNYSEEHYDAPGYNWSNIMESLDVETKKLIETARMNYIASNCSFCPFGCPYLEARTEARYAPIAVLNLAYLINEFQGEFSRFRDADLKILDECDMIESILLGSLSVSISPKQQKKLNIKPPKKKTVEDEWIAWVKYYFDYMDEMVKQHRKTPIRGTSKDALTKRRQRRYETALRDKLYRIYADIGIGEIEDEKTWIYTGYNRDYIEFKPVKVGTFGEEFLWKHGGKWLLMSGTIISPAVLANDIGLNHGDYKTVQVDYSFDANRRKVFINPVGSMKRGEIDRTLPRMGEKILHICNRHPQDRILIHTHAYHIADKITNQLASDLKNRGSTPTRRIYTYQNAAERELELIRFKETPGSILIAPSMDRGVDLPYDMCRVQVICKAPFPYLGDKVVSTRTYGTKGGELWYAVQTIRSIVQSTGRGMRHEDDEVVTYILDDDARKLIRTKRHLFPNWWLDALRS